MGVQTSAHGIRLMRSPYPTPMPSSVYASVGMSIPSVVVTGGGGGTPPSVVLVTAPATTGYAPLGIIAQGFGTTAGTNPITSYSFSWGDGATTDATKDINGTAVPIPIATHRYTVAGTYTLQLTVTDSVGNAVSATRTITVSARPATTVTITAADGGPGALTKLNAAAAGAVIRVDTGTYALGGSWTPKSNQIVWANGTVVFSGGNAIQYGVLFSTQTGVTIQGVRFTGYTSWALQFGANAGSGANATFSDCEVDTNGTNGVISGGLNGYHGGTIALDNCHFHHNRSYGADPNAGSTVVIIGGEYDHNFTDTSGAINPNAGDGVYKALHSTGDYIVGANIHDNQGSAAWWDTNNTNVYVALNMISSNYGQGTFWEVNDAAAGGPNNNIAGNLDGSGYSARILFNTLTANGYPATTWFPTGNIYPPSISIVKSNKVEVAYNWIDGGSHGVVLDYAVGRGEGHNLADIYVHDNDVRFRETVAGGGAGVGRMGFHNSVAGTAYALVNVRFDHNHYFAAHDSVGSGWTHFMAYIGTSEITTDFTTWKNTYGYDLNSTMALDSAWPH